MPVYEFACPNGHHVEDIRLIGESDPPDCKECGEKMRQVIGKGISFYNAGGAAQTRRSWN